MSKVNFFAQGLGLKPLSADPTSPTDGQLYMSDGTVRAAGLWRYSLSSVAWLAVGSGGGGLDVFHTEDFESNGASDFNTGNAATVDAAGTGTLDGTLADETSAPFSADASLKYTMGSTSTNDFFLQDADIAIELKQTSNDIGVSFYYTYNGDDDDIRFFALDQDDVELTDSIDYLEAASTPTRFTTSFYIPSGTTGIRYGFQVVTGNSAKIFIVDDIELSLNPFVYKDLVEMTDWTPYTPTTQGFGTISAVETEYRRVGSNLEVRGGFTAGTVTAVEAQFGLPSGLIVSNPQSADTQVCGYLRRDVASTSGEMSAMCTDGDTFINISGSLSGTFSPLDPRLATNFFGTGNRISLELSIPIEGWSSSSEHVVTPAKSNLTDWTSYTPTTQGFGTTSSNEFFYRRVGDSVQIRGRFQSGTPVASEAQIGLPSGLVVDSVGVPTVTTIGRGVRNNGSINTSKDSTILVTGGDAFLNIGIVSTPSAIDALAPRLGNAIILVGETFSFSTGSIPIEGWTSDAQFLAAIPVQKVAYIKDVKSSGTDAGAFTSGSWLTRDLNTVEGDIEIVSLSSNQFTLQCGKYSIEAESPAYSVNYHKIKLVSDPSGSPVDEVIGSTEGISAAAGTTMTKSKLLGTVTVISEETFEIQHRCTLTKTVNGFGLGGTLGVDEVYTQVKITKLR